MRYAEFFQRAAIGLRRPKRVLPRQFSPQICGANEYFSPQNRLFKDFWRYSLPNPSQTQFFSHQKPTKCVVLDLFSYQIVFILKTPCGLE